VKLPEYRAIDTRSLRRLRASVAFVGVIWTALGVIRAFSVEQTGGQLALSVFVWLVALGSLAFALTAHLEVQRRDADGPTGSA
jgi:hypothetical protein